MIPDTKPRDRATVEVRCGGQCHVTFGRTDRSSQKLLGVSEQLKLSSPWFLTADGPCMAPVFHRAYARVLRPSPSRWPRKTLPPAPSTRCWSTSTENSSAYGRASPSPLRLHSNVTLKGRQGP